jgi:hypothetical protein
MCFRSRQKEKQKKKKKEKGKNKNKAIYATVENLKTSNVRDGL